MSINYSAVVIYGTPFSEVPEEHKDLVKNMVVDGELDAAFPYYDAGYEDSFVGSILQEGPAWAFKVLNLQWQPDATVITDITGVPSRLVLTLNVS